MIFLTNNKLKTATLSSDYPEDSDYFPWENMYDNFLYTVGTVEEQLNISYTSKEDVNIVAIVTDSMETFTLQASNLSDFSYLILDTDLVDIIELPDTGLYLHVFKTNNPVYDSNTDYIQDNDDDYVLDNNDNKIKGILTGFAGKYSAKYWRILKHGTSNIYHFFMGLRFTFPNPLFGSYPSEKNTDVINTTISGQNIFHKGYEFKEQSFNFSGIELSVFNHLKRNFNEHRQYPGLLIQTEDNLEHRPVYFAYWSNISFGDFNGLRNNLCSFTTDFKEQK